MIAPTASPWHGAIVAVAVALAAAGPASGGDAAAVERRSAQIESLSLSVLESFPLRVDVTLRGVLADGCSRLESVSERFEAPERTYHLDVMVRRDAETMCAQVISEFELTVPIVKAGLAVGEFRVEAHPREATFEIEPLGEFPGFSLPAGGPSEWICAVESRVCFAAPEEWSRDGLSWSSPPFLSAQIGMRWWPEGASDLLSLLPPAAVLDDTTAARLSWGLGTRASVSEDEGRRWSEHVFAPCGAGTCEFWVAAPSVLLLEAAGETFWQLVRFAIRF